MRWMTFDIETARVLPPEATNLLDYLPLGIACAAIAFCDRDTEFWFDGDRLTRPQCQALVHRLLALQAEGYSLATWNGCSFDLRVLAVESGLLEECGELALHHVDLMAFVVCSRGHRLSLQAALEGAGLGGKVHGFRLADGRVIDPSGPNAPVAWAEGHRDAVLTYLRDDVEKLCQLMGEITRRHALCWTSRSGRPQRLALDPPPTVADCLSIALPDTSWMTDPPQRTELVEWIPTHHPAR